MSSDAISEPSIAEVQAALDDVRRTINVPFETVKAVAPIPNLADCWYEVRFFHGPALSVSWLKERDTFQQAVTDMLRRYFGADGSALLAGHDGTN